MNDEHPGWNAAGTAPSSEQVYAAAMGGRLAAPRVRWASAWFSPAIGGDRVVEPGHGTEADPGRSRRVAQ